MSDVVVSTPAIMQSRVWNGDLGKSREMVEVVDASFHHFKYSQWVAMGTPLWYGNLIYTDW